MDTLELKSIEELKNMVFYIPAYQRGYRWTEPQIKDLLDDILEFSQKKDAGIYCLQPLVVKESPKEQILDKIRNASDLDEVKRILKGKWEVVDGQQRLTTIRLILEVLQKPRFYDIEYETRKGSARFLNEIAGQTDKNAETNIDYHHIKEAVSVIREWWEKKGKETENFLKVLLERVKFIWYEIGGKEDPKEKEEEDPKEKKEKEEEDPKEVFTRLNIGKISLTNSELIKALLLNSSNFDANNASIKLRQQEIASEWDTIEYTLQNDEFWLFLHNKGYDRPTRIDFIFDLMCNQDILSICKGNIGTKEYQIFWEKIGTDEYRTFRYFYEYFHSGKADISSCWKLVKSYYQTFREWFNDLELYHYVGFLIACGKSVSVKKLMEVWREKQSKHDFLCYLKAEIKNKISLDDEEGSTDKTKCRPILLFHNIQTVINQNQTQQNNDKYKISVFYKFPFHLYKLEGWDVEHINSNTTNSENDPETQKEWLLNVYPYADETIREDIKAYFKQKEREIQDDMFDKIKESFLDCKEEWTSKEKNRIWNYTLLDSSTNRSYGNAIFPAKRRVIIGKDKGRLIPVPKLRDGKIEIGEERDASSSFVPPCTKHVFMKYYSSTINDNNYWTKADAKAYLEDIKGCLKKLNDKEEKQ